MEKRQRQSTMREMAQKATSIIFPNESIPSTKKTSGLHGVKVLAPDHLIKLLHWSSSAEPQILRRKIQSMYQKSRFTGCFLPYQSIKQVRKN